MSHVHTRSLVDLEGRPFLWAAFVLLVVLSLVPAFLLLKTGFSPTGTFDPASTLSELTRPSVLRAAWNSIESSGVSALLAVCIGTTAALAIGVTDIRGKRLFAFLFAMSMLVAPQVVALAFKTLAGPASPILKALGIAPAPGTPNPLMGRVGVILVLGCYHAPLAMLTVLAGLKGMPRTLVETAEIDGSSPWSITRRIVLPLIFGHIVAALLMTFVAALGNFGIPALLGLPVNYQTLPTAIYRQLVSFGPSAIGDAAALAILVGLIAALAVWLAARALNRSNATLEREHALYPYWRLGRLRPVAEAVCIVVVAVTLVMPLLSLLASALVPAHGVRLSIDTVTIRAFAEVLLRQQATQEAFRSSFLLAGSAAILLALASVPVAYALERLAGRFRTLMLFLVELPYALPGIVIAIAAILMFLKPLPLINISLYATPFIILFAYLARFLALAIKPVSASLAQLDRQVEEAAALCGACFSRRMTAILVPLLLPAMLAGGIFVFLIAFNELTVSALLWSPGTRTLGVVLYGFEEAGLTPEASALGVSTIVVVAALMFVIDRLGQFLPPGVVPWAVEERAV